MHYWFKSYSNFAERVNFAYWWSFSSGNLQSTGLPHLVLLAGTIFTPFMCFKNRLLAFLTYISECIVPLVQSYISQCAPQPKVTTRFIILRCWAHYWHSDSTNHLPCSKGDKRNGMQNRVKILALFFLNYVQLALQT